MNLVEQFANAPVKAVVPMSDDLRDVRFVPVERYPKELDGLRHADEVGMLCSMKLNEIHGVYERITCKVLALRLEKFSQVNFEQPKFPDKYVAASVPNTYFLDTRGQ